MLRKRKFRKNKFILLCVYVLARCAWEIDFVKNFVFDGFFQFLFFVFFCSHFFSDSQPMSELFMPAIRYILYTLHIMCYIYNRFIINNMKMKFNKNIKRTKPMFFFTIHNLGRKPKIYYMMKIVVALIYPCIIVPVFDDDILFIFHSFFVHLPLIFGLGGTRD